MTAKLVCENRFIVAYVTFQGEEFEYRFGRNCSKSHISATLPKLVMDTLFDRKIRERMAA
ncbi:hypothetical protein COJ96_06845 [Bacillus sp. AFS073361]|uniref:hypothetical protein n=1 Tax=Bacillus sp. AFS073361 TaxID=2033511 RepID=UPI000BF6B98F|nr:hypothetical protein [Bacillus sp. AFS073361]PFP30130.1 hypothetical protein COJ96_06845 [Bacillus sp. AFS073361]